jgi:hypothetical protein
MSLFLHFKEINRTTSIPLEQIDDKKDPPAWSEAPTLLRISLADWFLNLFNIFFTRRDNIELRWRYHREIKYVEFAVCTCSKHKFSAYEGAHQLLRTAAGTKVSVRITKDNRRQYRVALFLESEGPESVNEFLVKTRKRFLIYRSLGNCTRKK